MDIRHPLKETDMNMLEWSSHRQLPGEALLTKADKLSPGLRNNQVIGAVCLWPWAESASPQIQVEASSPHQYRREKLAQTLSGWYPSSRRTAQVDDEDNQNEE